MTLRAQLADFVPLEHHAQCAFVTDFDGTLSRIVDDPAHAAAVPEAMDALRTLAAHLGLVAVISGRPVDFLRQHVPIDNVAMVGQYGLERLVDGRVVVDPLALEHVDAMNAALVDAERHWPTLLVERKGDIAFALHWRMTPDDEPNPDDLLTLARDHGLSAFPAKMAFELRPPVAVDKGVAFTELAGGYRYRAFAGDDHSDVAVFTTEFDGSRAPVRIAVRSDETPPQLIELADVVVDGPEGFAAMLTELADAVSSSAQP